MARYRLEGGRILDLEVMPAAAPLLRVAVLGRRLLRGELAAAVGRALEAAGAPTVAAIGLVLADDATLAELNEAHMGHRGPTDVLSFPLLPPEAFPPHPGAAHAAPAGGDAVSPGAAGFALPGAFALPPHVRPQLGEIVVSVERAVAQARGGSGGWTGDVRWDSADELLLLATHGVLHVCGWDHAVPAERDAMRALESSLLARAGAGPVPSTP